MQVARIRQIGAVVVLGLGLSGRAAVAQSRSAVLRVTAQVVDVGALSWAPAGGADQAAVVTGGGALGQVFSVVPPQHAAVAVSMHVEGGPSGSGDMAIHLCRPTDARRGCRRVMFADAQGGRHAAAVTDEAVLVRLTGLTLLAEDPTRVTVTLAYPDS